MSKRSVTELQTVPTADGSGNKRPFRANSTVTEDMGEFEDGWEDEFESDEEVVDAEEGEGTLLLSI